MLKVVEEKKLKPLSFTDILDHLPLIKLKLNKADLGG